MGIEITLKCLFTVFVAVFLVLTLEGPRKPVTAIITHPRIVIDTTKLDYGYCHSSPTEVDEGTTSLLTVLNHITASPFFRYFKVNSNKPCPYWAVSLLCTGAENKCDVCKCDENSIPKALHSDVDMSTVDTPDGTVAESISKPGNLDDWGMWQKTEDGAEYVDLVANPEGNTGYTGPLAAQVWRAIYAENCLSPEDDGMCQEVSILRTLLSGLHMSINMHVSTNFYKDPELASPQHKAGIYNNDNISFYPNCEMYNQRVAPFPDFVGNLYILYQFTLRALAKAKPFFLKDLSIFNTGFHGEATATDLQLRESIKDLFASRLLCSPTFDESAFLESEKGRELIPQFKSIMLNVTHLMDCVTCEKCRIWGKLETKGIAVAMKIIMSREDEPITLDRSEMVTLVNLARQLAFSVRNAQRLGTVCKESTNS
ncbi:putative endoplasmic reticulum oxidoreductin [Leptomonas pyrrhocoris]|uniref:Putative endoplasmic reticulum oxidoreductin n=1 Tax=Leptomonas pyrrhocoris TaxID=157538 RepID=A0A0M9FXN3_LEPPY|nr:putative endoplasmic reticulum oxidoreductin [Leptomonas pyrrhocoris]XP_015656513.1 putative endoplasmic reticulum oxidoreductin [Leptomonas pyrrhocoris]KPA78073.1 putative endoplasmic reticulum oxidoreductin [Leptomonas pyrrhocoris]KPA78074.1 putative endoplasmic reticulum oxidoreductin [Leptomonas pyrrhocoris]|eukprot:XP_015656512.1 putative endoplasmic reticulum oxidoreductin [Leptomonas pyrrhocoris]